MIDYIGVGGSGGHCAPEYFNYLLIPKFPQKKKEEITKLYYYDNKKMLGIYQLDKENMLLKRRAKVFIDKIVAGEL